MSKTRVLVVDDRADVAASLASFIEAANDSQVVGTATGGHEAVRKAIELRPDIVLMDFSMQDMDGVAAAELIRTELPGTEVVILSVYAPEDHAERARRAGVRTWLSKSAPLDRLLDEVRRVSQQRDPRTNH